MATDIQFATGVSLPIGKRQQRASGLLVAQALAFEPMWHHVKEHCEQKQVFEQRYTEQVWDLAHVGVRAMRRVMAIEKLEYPTHQSFLFLLRPDTELACLRRRTGIGLAR